MLLNDKQIKRFAEEYDMIHPFVPNKVRVMDFNHNGNQYALNVLSYGLSHYGYDLRLSPQEFKIFRHVPGTVVNPKRFNEDNLEPAKLHEDQDGQFFILPGHSYGLGVSIERLNIPPFITALFIGKSTNARIGVIANLTPGEAGWCGSLTLEFSNSSCADCRIYANEGVVQALFLEGEPCETPYGDGKYQNQGAGVTLARV